MTSHKASKNAATPRLLVDCGVAWAKFCALYPALKPEAMPTIQFNNRLRTTSAQIRTYERIIEIASKLYVGNEDEYSNIIVPHELAHMVDFDLNGDPGNTSKQHHGPSWQAIMIRYGIPPDPYHNLEIG